ncbi:DEAD/DEAH box helicase [Microbacterium lacticum]|uniref:DEAD/DEAH box helicase n=1 Tax=Microbacterium lacticum TaxID=33885 RepID=UPI001F59B9E6|nr:DEAD/DEAH box helicase [Microbacterium lacticum]
MSVTTEYEGLIARRAQLAGEHGFVPDELPEHLFPFQRALVEWSLRTGRSLIAADCGLGKTPMELAWAEAVYRHTGKPVLLLTPLAVAFQHVAEARKFGHDAAISRDGRVAAPITITNYDQAVKFDPDDFSAVVADESSAIKAYDGSTRAIVTELMRRRPYRLGGTATAAPNDWLELGTQSEALGVLGYMDMLSRFFVNDNRTATQRSKFAAGGRGVGFRLKGHAQQPFWRWVASWARAVRRPSDLGFTDAGYDLPELLERVSVVEARMSRPDTLFDMPAVGLHEEREETRRTLTERCEAAAAALEHVDSGVAWCQLNDESSLLAKLIPGAEEVTGSDSTFEKEEKLAAFSRGEIRVLVTKPSIGAWGLNWQHCHRMTYFPTHSYEQYYQAVRRSWRFGQTRPVEVDLITTEGGRNVLANLHRKAAQADQMFSELVRHMNEATSVDPYVYDQKIEVPSWLAS